MFQAVYASHAVYPMGHPSDADILRVARRQAAEFNLTGFLLRTEWAFAGAFEGDGDAVARMFDAVLRDPRHRVVRAWGPYPILMRGFDGWAMGYGPLGRDGFIMPKGVGRDAWKDRDRILCRLRKSAGAQGDECYGATQI